MRMVILKRKLHNLYKEICKRRLALLLFYLVNSDILAFIIFYNMVSLIKDVEVFQTSVMTAAGLAEKGHLVTFGIVPTFPATGYGYVKGGEHVAHHVYSLEKFVEKPVDILLKTDIFFNNPLFFLFLMANKPPF